VHQDLQSLNPALHTPPADRMYATDVGRQTDVRRQTASSLNAPWAGA